MPDFTTKRRIFQIHTRCANLIFHDYGKIYLPHSLQPCCSKMSLADDVNLDEFVMTKDDLSGADIKAICTESGLLVSDDIRNFLDGHLAC